MKKQNQLIVLPQIEIYNNKPLKHGRRPAIVEQTIDVVKDPANREAKKMKLLRKKNLLKNQELDERDRYRNEVLGASLSKESFDKLDLDTLCTSTLKGQ